MTKPVIGIFVGLLLGIAWGGVGDFGAFALAAFFAALGYVAGRAIDAGVAEDVNQYLSRGRRR
jgi:hypothetical protein